jgi:hypothetical protein
MKKYYSGLKRKPFNCEALISEAEQIALYDRAGRKPLSAEYYAAQLAELMSMPTPSYAGLKKRK